MWWGVGAWGWIDWVELDGWVADPPRRDVNPRQQDMPFLILATLKGNVRVMTFLLEKEVESVNVRDAHHGNTPLHYAVRAQTRMPLHLLPSFPLFLTD